MYPSKPNANAEASTNDSPTSRLTPDEKQESHTEFGYQSTNPLAPLLPSNTDVGLPSYTSTVTQDSNDPNILNASSSTGSNPRPDPPASPHIDGTKPTSGLDNQPAYQTGPEPTIESRISTGGYPSYGATATPITAPFESEGEIGHTGVVTKEPKSANLGPTAEQRPATTEPGNSNPDKEDEFRPDTAPGTTNSESDQTRQHVSSQDATELPDDTRDERLSIFECCLLCCYCIQMRFESCSECCSNKK